MSELQTKFQAIIKKIEDRIQNEEELNFIKEQIADISVLFLDQLDKVVELTDTKLKEVVKREKELENKVRDLEKNYKVMKEEFFLEDSYDFEIICPYCNYEFVADFSQSVKEEVECPECHNIIELDWNGEEEEEGCAGHCSGCAGHCGDEEEIATDEAEPDSKNEDKENSENNIEDNEDDM